MVVQQFPEDIQQMFGGLTPPIYLDPTNPQHQALVNQLRATRPDAVPYPAGPAVSGIGQMRDLGDPNDPRRGTAAPRPANVPGLPNPIDLLIAQQRAELAAQPPADAPIPRPAQQDVGSPTNTGYTDREFGIARGFGAGGNTGGVPLARSDRWQKDPTSTEANPKPAWRSGPAALTGKRNPAAGSPAKRVSPGEVEMQAAALAAELSALGIPLDEADAAMLAEIARTDTAQRNPGEIEGVREVQTQDRKKRKGFGRIPQGDLDSSYTGGRRVPNQTGPEIAPYQTVTVPRAGYIEGRRTPQIVGTTNINPEGQFRTEQADDDTVANALHASEEEVKISNANAASTSKTENRTQLVKGDVLNQLRREGKLVRVNGKGTHVADIINPDDSRTPVYQSTGVGQRGLYRIGAPTNINFDAVRDELNPRAKEESSDFDTQVKTYGARFYDDPETTYTDPDGTVRPVRRQVPGTGVRVEEGPMPMLNRSDVYPGVAGMRIATEKNAALTGKGGPHLAHLPEGVQERIVGALDPRPKGGTRAERIAHDTQSSFVGRKGLDTSGLATPVRGIDQALVQFDQVMNELAGAGYMAAPDVANGYQRLALQVQAGRLGMDDIPPRARGEVARELQVLGAEGGPVERVPIQSQAIVEDLGRTADGASERGGFEQMLDYDSEVEAYSMADERNFDDEGRVVQGTYGDFGQSTSDQAGNSGITVRSFEDGDYSPEFRAAQAAVDEMYGFTSGFSGISLENQIKRDQLAGQVLAQAVNATPSPMVAANNQVFQAELRKASAQLGGSEPRVIQGRSSAWPAAERATTVPDQMATVEEGTARPQAQSRGVVNSDSVSQVNAPAPPQNYDVDPEVARLLPYVNDGQINQAAVDNITRGLKADPGSASNNAARALLARFRRQFS